MALWRDRPGAMTLAPWAVGLSCVAAMITALTPIWPHRLPPGVREPATVLLFVWYAGWFSWVVRLLREEERRTKDEERRTKVTGQ